tara:strand:- start:223 stop:564 length:342 start_codon:yes stop_codon:yes gene_type:complete
MSNPHSGHIPGHMYPFYRVFDEKGKQYCDCSHEKYAIRTVELHEEYQNETFTYRRIDAPKPLPPVIIDVNAEHEGELPGQQGLPAKKKRLPFEPELGQLQNSTLEEFTIFEYD